MKYKSLKQGILRKTVYDNNRSHYAIWVIYPGAYDLSIRFYYTTPKHKSKFRRKFTLKSHKNKTEYILSYNRAIYYIKTFCVMKFPIEVISRLDIKNKKYQRIYLDNDHNIIQIAEKNKGRKSDHNIDDILKVQNGFFYKFKCKIKKFFNYENNKRI